MKKGKKLPIIAVLILILIAGVLWYFLQSDKPFDTMSANEIAQVTVYAIPPDEEATLTEAEIASFIPLLQNLKVANPKASTAGLGGQTVKFTVLKTDGSTIEISNIGNVKIIIDGKNYKADYESAEALNNFANKVLETGF